MKHPPFPASLAAGHRHVFKSVRNHLAVIAGRLMPKSFRAKITLAIALIIIVMMTALIVTQNIVVARTTAEANQTMTMCANEDGTISVATGSDTEDGPAADGTGDYPVVCYTGSKRNLDGMEFYVPYTSQEWDAAKDKTKNGPWILDEYNGVMINTANAVTNTLTTTMRTVSIIALAVFGVFAVVAAWLIGTMLSRRVTAVDRQVAALQPNDLTARLDVKPGHDDIDRLVDSINGMLDRVEAASEAERRFVSNASHELRTPIAAVETNLDAPLAQGRFPADVEPSVRRALAANRRGAQLVQALLTLSRIQSGTIGGPQTANDGAAPSDGAGSTTQSNPLPRTATGATVGSDAARATDLTACVNDMIDDVADDAAMHDITVHADNLPAVRVAVDHALLELAVGNLVRNAVVHNVNGGSIDVAIVQNGDDAESKAGDGCVTLTVTNGTDEMLPGDLNELTQPFHRGEHSRISAAPGVGLGLSIVDAACHAMGTTLTLSQPDSDTFRATIRFPR
ncbi:sensor histidine kinase [Bifidobacterium callitrichidarum]|uniref:histidine kinase n=1 Tax=Bifidobacterium callitrichidarum TaxID=2052941 RepID=A0A2U2NCP7_9BIFI|nr:HAMP domain-containing sensor histidine kinase [Bifidobacterium callitrichidarum]PWG66926.1 sensor histidine kinase [Bifidobacterium callitrichidarum]